MATRLKVRKADLLERLFAERAKIKAKFERDKEAYEGKIEQVAVKIKRELDAFSSLLDSNLDGALKRCDNRYNGGLHITFPKVSLPVKPSSDTRKLDRLIRTLEISSDDEIYVRADDDFAAYL